MTRRVSLLGEIHPQNILFDTAQNGQPHLEYSLAAFLIGLEIADKIEEFSPTVIYREGNPPTEEPNPDMLTNSLASMMGIYTQSTHLPYTKDHPQCRVVYLGLVEVGDEAEWVTKIEQDLRPGDNALVIVGRRHIQQGNLEAELDSVSIEHNRCHMVGDIGFYHRLAHENPAHIFTLAGQKYRELLGN